MVRLPGKLPEDKVVDEPVISLDIFPTICAAASIELPSDRVYDGRNLLPLLTGRSNEPLHEALYWDGDEGKQAIRAGKWKLVMIQDQLELFDLENDLGEQHDLADRRPKLVTQLKEKFDAWRREMAPRIGRARQQPVSKR